jgi:CRP/FNR family cyclic AMP-dependent transcriptional regulator
MSSQPTLNLFRFVEEFDPYAAGQAVFTEGDPGKVMYVVKEGEVAIIAGDKVLDVIQPGGIFGEMALIDQQPRSASAIARTDCTLIRVDEARFMFLVQQTPRFALEVMRLIVGRLRRMNART